MDRWDDGSQPGRWRHVLRVGQMEIIEADGEGQGGVLGQLAAKMKGKFGGRIVVVVRGEGLFDLCRCRAEIDLPLPEVVAVGRAGHPNLGVDFCRLVGPGAERDRVGVPLLDRHLPVPELNVPGMGPSGRDRETGGALLDAYVTAGRLDEERHPGQGMPVGEPRSLEELASLGARGGGSGRLRDISRGRRASGARLASRGHQSRREEKDSLRWSPRRVVRGRIHDRSLARQRHGVFSPTTNAFSFSGWWRI